MRNPRHVIIPAGGIGSRMGLPYPKQLMTLDGRTLLDRVLDVFAGEQIIVAVPGTHEELFRDKVGNRARIVLGGDSRFQSVRNAFATLNVSTPQDLVLIHDAARPFLDRTSLPAAWRQAEQQGALIYAAPAIDTIKIVDHRGLIRETPDRAHVVHAQTPQIFTAQLLEKAYAAYDTQPWEKPPTDEAGLVEWAGIAVSMFPSTFANRKLTLREDLALFHPPPFRCGHGYDVHRFQADRPLYLGGVLIPDTPGLAGHSDADVAIHALIDALLGAAGRGDIGHWFPDTDPSFEQIRSTELLTRVWQDLVATGFTFVNGDLTIQAQVPKLAPYIVAMRQCLADILQTEPDRLNIKATTTEGLGFVGRKEGMAAHAVVLLTREESQ